MFKIFAFDLGNVIIPFDHSTISTRLLKYSKIKERLSQEDINNYLYKDEQIEHLYEEGKITTTQFIKNIKDRFKLDISNEEFRAIFCDIFFEPYPQTVEKIKEIKTKSLPLLLISNTNEMHFEYIIDRYKIVQLFDYYLLSYKFGVRKPDKKIYQELIRISNCRPEEIFYIDDMLEYIKSASELNISAYHFTSPEDIKKYLTPFNLKITL